jgi:glycosyltransferase involved in cell wall biosynthesis
VQGKTLLNIVVGLVSLARGSENMQNNLVSIIIPTYNGSKYVCDAIDCAMKQTYQPCEIIVIDDGSTDNTRSLLTSKYGNRIRYIYQNNKGLSGARNTGIRHAKGDFIQFLDADDLIAPEKIEMQVDSLLEVKGLALSYSDYYYCDINDVNRVIKEYYLSPLIKHDMPLHDLASRWETELSIPVQCYVFQSSFFKDYGIMFDESLPTHEDWDCWMKIFALKPVFKFVNEPLAIVRVHNQSMCRNRKPMRQGFLKAIKKQQIIFKRDHDMTKILESKEKQTRQGYRDVGPMREILSRVPVIYKNAAKKIIPARIKRFVDEHVLK